MGRQDGVIIVEACSESFLFSKKRGTKCRDVELKEEYILRETMTMPINICGRNGAGL